jgi:hypothetical protein|tara:strand:+ start:5018 stop:5314 length:297 start_codon:yes stop_codon:yes gene_type:complete
MAWTKMAAVQVGGGCKICIASYLDGRLEGFDFPVHHLNSAVAAAAAAAGLVIRTAASAATAFAAITTHGDTSNGERRQIRFAVKVAETFFAFRVSEIL